MSRAKVLAAAYAGGPQRLTTNVKETLLDWIRRGKYPPGSHLPSVPDLVEKLSVSRTVVREALQSLVGMNVVDIRPGLGCFVKSVPADLIVNADVMAALIDMDTLIQVAIARMAIEGSVARIAATQATDEDFAAIDQTLVRIRRLARENLPMYSVTPEFHVAVAHATHNPVLKGVITSLNELMTAAGEVIERETQDPDYRNAEYRSHLELLQVLKMRNPQRAQEAMEAHVQKTVDALQAVHRAANAS